MSRNDLTQKEETWSEAALAGGDFSKYAICLPTTRTTKNSGRPGHHRKIRSGAREGPREGSSCGHGATAPPPVQRSSSADDVHQ